MEDRPNYLLRGERARLFPVLSENSKEGRATSIFLSCLSAVQEYGARLLGSVGQRVGSRARIECFTEVAFDKTPNDAGDRPDGLIIFTVGNRTWRAIVEAKIGNNALTSEQITRYLDLAAANEIDAVITISNEFATSPATPPVDPKTKSRKKVALFHWSWMYLLTEADILASNNEVADSDQHYLLQELKRFLTHASAGVKGFDRMPSEWDDVCRKVSAGGQLSANAPEVETVVRAWHQEVRDLSLILSRQVGATVNNRLPRVLVNDAAARLKADRTELAASNALNASLQVPNTAGAIDIVADLNTRSITASLKLKAPGDKQSTKARLNWLIRQVGKGDNPDVYLRLIWPGRGVPTQHNLNAVRENPDMVVEERAGQQVASFEICMVRQTGKRFSQAKNFVSDLENLVPDFYEVVQDLKAWTPPAPRIKGDRQEPSDVSVGSLGERVEAEVGIQQPSS